MSIVDLIFQIHFGASDMKVFDLTENKQRVKYIIMTGGYTDYVLHDIFRFDNLKYGFSTQSLLKCIAFEFEVIVLLQLMRVYVWSAK